MCSSYVCHIPMWSDNETAVDLLSVQHIVAAVLTVVRDPRLSPVTVGVYGDWGSGKSSAIRMVQAELDADPKCLVIHFNGWRFEGYEDAKVALASTILERIEEELKRQDGKLTGVAEGAKSLLGDLWARIDRLRLMKAVTGAGVNAGIAAGGVALAGFAAGAPIAIGMVAAAAVLSLADQARKIDGTAVAELLEKQEQKERDDQRATFHAVREFRAHYEKLVAKLGLTRLVVIVDDLDRCLPSSVIETFEAIRLFLSVPHTAFVIAADEGVIRHAVTTRFPAYEEIAVDGGRRKVDVGGRYLEKFVQVPVRIPPLAPRDLHGYLNLLFAEKHAADSGAFPAFCQKVREATSYDEVAFRAENAEALLGVPPSEELKEDLALAERIAPVLGLSAEGNPRQTKRFLNALLLRLQMADGRKISLDRAVAAKLLLLEYFQPQLFADVAREAMRHNGKPPEFAPLEASARSGTPVTDALPPYAISLMLKPQPKAWFASEPRLADVDLRPYIYFASERPMVAGAADERLSPAAQKALSDLLSASDPAQRAGAQAAAELSLTEVNVIVAALARAALAAEDLRAEVSPLTALYYLAEHRADVVPDVLRAVGTLPAERLPSSTARVAELGKRLEARDVAQGLLDRWAGQSVNKGLQTSAVQRGERLRKFTVEETV